ncbi:hypothetical protein [Gallibacterium anatis]|uniref:hypothetical protein n=1 Tax=Gallibacterium anatis TaxID=750 RepID=UPI000BA04AB1|nr:hypothetical protein [Gallibacterium anatis]WAX71585.1 hypothetical protein CF557_00600 [Gallibacterium anatis]
MKFTLEPIYLITALIIAVVLGISCQPQPVKALEKDTDYYDHTLNLETTLSEEQQQWQQWAKEEWKKEHGNLQTPLTAEHEAEIRAQLAEGQNG